MRLRTVGLLLGLLLLLLLLLRLGLLLLLLLLLLRLLLLLLLLLLAVAAVYGLAHGCRWAAGFNRTAAAPCQQYGVPLTLASPNPMPAGRWCWAGGRGGAARSGAWRLRTAHSAPSALSACGMCRCAWQWGQCQQQQVPGLGSSRLLDALFLLAFAAAHPLAAVVLSRFPPVCPAFSFVPCLLIHALPSHSCPALQPGEMIIIDEQGRLHSRQVAQVRPAALILCFDAYRLSRCSMALVLPNA